MPTSEIEELFNAAPHEEYDDEPELITDTTGSSIKSNSSIPSIIDGINLVKPEEIRSNYDDARDALKSNLDITKTLMDNLMGELEHVTPDPGKQNRLYESVAILLKANTDSAKVLAGLHKETGSALGNAKKIEMNDNRMNQIKLTTDDMQDIIDAMRR
jgi:hypothetical protein